MVDCVLNVALILSGSIGSNELFLKGHIAPIAGVVFAQAGKTAASVDSASNDVHLWDTSEAKKIKILTCPRKDSRFGGLAIANDGKEIAIAVDDSLIRWDLETGSHKETLEKNDDEYVNGPRYSRDEAMVAYGIGNQLVVLDRKKSEIKHRFKVSEGRFVFVDFTTDSKYVIGARVIDREWDLYGWRIGSNEQPFILKEGKRTISGIVCGGKSRLFSGGWDSRVVCWDLNRKERIATIDAPQAISRLAISPNGEMLAIATYGGGVDLWDSGKLKHIRNLKAEASVSAVSFSPDARSLLLGYGNPFASTPREDRGKLVLIRLP